MGIIDKRSGHSSKDERKVAGLIYIAISIAVVIGVLLAIFLGQQKDFDPQKSGDPDMIAPDAGPGEANPGRITQ